MGVAVLIHECFKRTKMLRTDLQALDEFDKAQSSGGTPDGVKLFWDMWRPKYTLVEGGPIGYQDNPPALDDDLEDAVLEELARLERECRITYVPDEDLWGDYGEPSESVIRYIHVGAASALRHQKRDSLNEDVVETLQRVSGILRLLDMPLHRARRILADVLDVPYDPARPFVPYLVDAPHDIVSRIGVRALVLRELANVRFSDSKYREAFELAFDSFVCAEAVWDAVDVDRQFLIEEFGEEVLALEEETRAAIRKCLPLHNPQQLVECFEELKLKRQDKSDNWPLVARQCARLAATIDEALSESSVPDGNRQEIDWYGYWRRAQGWAEEHLGPQEYRKLREDDAKEASENRLKRYFFGELWEKIPAKARKHLVNVDSAWFDKSRGRGFGTVLEDLQIATEVMCNSLIWKPLLNSPGDQMLLPILAKDRELQEKEISTNISNFAWVCRQQGFKKFVQEKGIRSKERQFLHEDLPKALYSLRGERNPARHDHERSMGREEVEQLVQSFLGIGRKGVLRSLVEVGQKLVSK